MQDFLKSVEINPEHAPSYTNIGVCYNNLNQNEKALEFFTQALKINPIFVDGLVIRGKFLTNIMKDHEQASEDLLKAKNINTKPDREIDYNLGVNYVHLKRYEQAKLLLEPFIPLFPEDPELHHYYAKILYGLGQTKKAKAYVKRAYDINPFYWKNLNEDEQIKHLNESKSMWRELVEGLALLILAAVLFLSTSFS